MPSSRLNPSTVRRIICGLLLSALLSLGLMGCSVVRVGYGQLPELAYWWVDGYLNLDDAQSRPLRSDLRALHDWHRSQELPQLAQWLRQLELQALQNTSPQTVCQITDQLRTRMDAIAAESVPGFTRLALSLSPEQLQTLKTQLDKRAAEWRQDWLEGDPAALAKRRLERLVDRSENFYGSLSESQLALLSAGLQSNPFDARLALADMLRRHQDLLATLGQLAGQAKPLAQAQQDIRALLVRTLRSPDAAYRDHTERLLQNNCRLFADLHNSASPAQRQKLLTRLQGFEADARALMPQ